MVYDAGKMRAECGKLNEVRCAEQCVQSRQPGDREKKSLGDSHIGSASVLKPRTEIAFVESERVDGYLFERSGCANDNWLCKGF